MPNSKSRIEACGGVRECALLAILALTYGFELVDVDCPSCGLPLIDYSDSLVPRTKHVCGSCGSCVKSGKRGVCNPLLSFLDSEKSENSFA